MEEEKRKRMKRRDEKSERGGQRMISGIFRNVEGGEGRKRKERRERVKEEGRIVRPRKE